MRWYIALIILTAVFTDDELEYLISFFSFAISLVSFDLGTPISIKEAIFALDYIDHDFYVFRDEESNEVSVVYKRNAGGVGLIQPEAWTVRMASVKK